MPDLRKIGDVDKLVRRVLCESDPRWPTLNEQQQAAWLANAHGDTKRYLLCIKAAVRAYEAGMERARGDAERWATHPTAPARIDPAGER